MINDFIPFDIFKIPIDILRKQYIDYKTNLPISKYTDSQYKTVVEESNETKQIESVIDDLKVKFFLDDWQCLVARAHNNIDVALVIPNTENNKKLIINEMESCGYFVGKTRNLQREDMYWLQIQFEPYHSKSINDEIKSDDVLYHITSINNEQSILDNGIVPTNEDVVNGKKSNRPNMVFLLREYTGRIQWKKLAQIINKSRPNNLKSNRYVVFQIEINKLPKNIVFQGDPEHPSGVCTYSKIPKKAIKLLTYIDL